MFSAISDWLKTRNNTTRNLTILIYCFIASLLFLLFQGGKVALMLFLVMTFISVYLALGKWSGISAVTGKRMLHAKSGSELTAGASVHIKMNIAIPGFWPLPYVIVKERLYRNNGATTHYEMTFVPDWNRKGVVEYTIPPLRRGHYYFGETVCSTEDVFGLFEHKGVLDLKHSFRILPHTVEIKQWHQFNQLLKGARHHSTAIKARRETTQIDGVREYVYGDRISRIHWKMTARTGVWKSKEFERESLPKMMVVLDRDANSYSNEAQFELAVSTAATLIRFALREQLAIGLLSVGEEVTHFEARQGAQHHKQMMSHLIDVEADGAKRLEEVVGTHRAFMSQGTFTLLISPQQHAGSLLRMLSLLRKIETIPTLMWMPADDAHAVRERQALLFKQLQVKGHDCYAIYELAELPQLLGGR